MNETERQPTYRIRVMRRDEYGLLEDFLYEAIFIRPGDEIPPKSIIYEPLLWRTIADFGKRTDDYCLVAETAGWVIGAVWVRIADQYGHLDDEPPSFSISLYKEYRGQGIGTALMRAMLQYLKEKGYPRASLSVQKDNYALRMYRAVGIEIIGEDGPEYIMVHRLQA